MCGLIIQHVQLLNKAVDFSFVLDEKKKSFSLMEEVAESLP